MHVDAANVSAPATGLGLDATAATNSGTSELNSCQRNRDDLDAPTAGATAACGKHRFKVLYLFSGPWRPTDGFESHCRNLGMDCTCIDIEYNDAHDLLDQNFWEELEGRLDEFDAYLITPPCCTFTAARSAGRKGPKPLRGIQGKDRYGLKGLKLHDVTKVKEGTLLACRGAKVASFAHRRNKPWIIEQPHWRPGNTSMYMLDEYMDLSLMDGVAFHTFDQCMFGVEFEKKTDLLSNIDHMECFECLCSHPRQMWVIPWNGERCYSSHPPLKGKQIGIPESLWSPSMLKNQEPEGDFLTRKTAAYTSQMNKQLAEVLFKACSNMTGHHARANFSEPTDQNFAADVKVVQSNPLHGTVPEPLPDDENSLRNVHRWVTPRMQYLGKQIMNVIERSLDEHPCLEKRILDLIGSSSVLEPDLEQFVDKLRTGVLDVLVRNRREHMPTTADTSEIDTGTYKTVIRGHLLKYWADCVDDPGREIVSWLYQGAPAGLTADTSLLDSVCPKVEPDDLVSVDTLFTDFEGFENYLGVESSEEAKAAIKSYADKGYIREFATLNELRQHLGAEPILSKLGCIVRSKTNPVTNVVTTKTRIILDCRRSQVSSAAARTHKSVLPRTSDAIQQALYMMSDCGSGESVTFLVADIVDAFWLIPLRYSERRFFCAKLSGRYYCFERTAQGSRAAPLTFAAIIALASRWVQSVASTPLKHGNKTGEAILQTYVDDPLFAIRGDPLRQSRIAVIILLAWSIMGFPLAFHKAVFANNLTWIGIQLHIESDGIRAVVPENKVAELQGLVTQALKNNVISKKVLRTIIGKAMSIASVLYCWRPFIQELYTALYAKDTHAPVGCVWIKQIRHSFVWILTFLKDEQTGIVRKYSLKNFSMSLPMVTITWDASPFGMGGTLQLDGEFVEYFSIDISIDDQRILETEAGRHEGQQTWEALAGLISLRLWQRFWFGQRAKLQIRADNIGSLTVLTALKGGSKQLSLIAREYALDLGLALWKPDIATHIPGISNVTCDVLSRKKDPNKKFAVPLCLRKAKEVFPPPRDLSWWKTLSFERTISAPISSPAHKGNAEIATSSGDKKRRRI